MLVEAPLGNIFDETLGYAVSQPDNLERISTRFVATRASCPCEVLSTGKMPVSQEHGPTDSKTAVIDWLDLTWIECAQRALRRKSRGGRDVRIMLGLGVTLRHGDVLWRADDHSAMLAVNVLLSEVLVARPRSSIETASLAYELGNLHTPIQLIGDVIVMIDDGPILAVLDRLGIPFESQSRRFEPTLRGGESIRLADHFTISRRA